jgi:hydrogenase maturation protein HypF
MELESLAGHRDGMDLPFPVREGPEGRWILDPLPLLVALGEEMASGAELPELAAGFHDAIAGATVNVAIRVAEEAGLGRVALGGGVFQNARLIHGIATGLSRVGLEVLLPRVLSPNDGGISFGQAAVAAALLQSGGS